VTRASTALAACLHGARSTSHVALLTSLTPDDWTAVVALAGRHGVTGLLPELAEFGAPPSVTDAIRARAVAAAKRTLLQRSEFLALASALEPLGVPLIALKGIHLALTFGPTLAREMADIDVLVRRADVDTVEAAAGRLGYRHDAGALARVPHHVPTMKKSGVLLEIHWRLADEGHPPTASPDDLWAGARPLPAGANVFGLAPEDALLHVCAHAAYSHYFEHGIRPLCDIRALVAWSDPAIDWDIIASRAVAWQCERGVTMGLWLARDLLGVPVPDGTFDRLGGAPPAGVVAASVGQVFAERTAIHRVSGPAGQLLMPGSLWARVSHAAAYLWLAPEQVAALYPDRRRGSRVALALATVRRAADLIRRYGGVLLRAGVRRDSPERHHVERRRELLMWLERG
jgi:hypothetical protein